MTSETAEVLSPSKKHKPESESKSLLSHFDVKVSEFLAEMKLAPKMVVIESHVGLQAAFGKLVSNHILSAPVQEEGRFVGFLDIRDLVSFVLFAAKEHAKHSEDMSLDELMSNDNFFKSTTHTVTSIVEQTKMHDNPLQAITVSYLCRRNRFAAVSTQDTLLKVLQLLSTKELHRVPVQNEEGNLVAVISQSNIIEFLGRIFQRDPQSMQQSIMDLKLGRSPVYTALASAPAYLAFELMDKKQIFGVAVVDDQGVLVGNISASDIKLFLQSPNFSILYHPLLEFLTAIRRKELRTRVPVAVVPADATLANVVSKLAATKMHRLFVCDAGKHPTLVITLTNVLAALLTGIGQ
jgi:CBS domain-containing protein